MNQLPGRMKLSEVGHYMIPAIEEVKQGINQIIAEIDRNHPDWKRRDEAAPRDWAKHDARRFFFFTLRSTLVNAEFNYIFLTESLLKEDWWRKWASVYDPTAAHLQVEEYGRMVRWLTFHQTAMHAEEVVRAIIRSDQGDFDISLQVSSKPLYNLYSHLLRKLGLGHLRPLFEILRLTRNTLHTNGIFLPPDSRDKVVQYEGQRFDFKVGQDASWFNEHYIVWMAQEISQAIWTIVRTSIVGSIPYCSRT